MDKNTCHVSYLEKSGIGDEKDSMANLNGKFELWLEAKYFLFCHNPNSITRYNLVTTGAAEKHRLIYQCT